MGNSKKPIPTGNTGTKGGRVSRPPTGNLGTSSVKPSVGKVFACGKEVKNVGAPKK